MNALELVEVGVTFGSITALTNVSLTVTPGEMVALTGRSGSGKSTLLNVAAGLITPLRGSVTVMGEPLQGHTATELADVRSRHVGFVFQNLNLLARLDVADNVALPLELRGSPSSTSRVAAEAALEAVGLGGRGSARPAELSGGEQQRAAVARALVTRPSLIIADEPTAALDSITAESIMALIRKACDDWKAAALVVTHDPSQAAWGDQVLHLRNGSIAGSSSRGEPPAGLTRMVPDDPTDQSC